MLRDCDGGDEHMTDAGERTALSLPGRRTAGGRARPAAEAPGAQPASCAMPSAATPSSAKPCVIREPVVASRSFADKVMAAVEQEPADRASRAPRLPSPAFAACGRLPESASPPRWRRWRSSRCSAPASRTGTDRANEPAAAPTAVVAQSADERRKLHRADEHFAVGVRAGHAPHELCRRSQRIFLAARPPLGADRRACGRRWRPGCRDGRRAEAGSAVSVAAGAVAVAIAPR